VQHTAGAESGGERVTLGPTPPDHRKGLQMEETRPAKEGFLRGGLGFTPNGMVEVVPYLESCECCPHGASSRSLLGEGEELGPLGSPSAFLLQPQQGEVQLLARPLVLAQVQLLPAARRRDIGGKWVSIGPNSR
jgi:hypothetical protein